MHAYVCLCPGPPVACINVPVWPGTLHRRTGSDPRPPLYIVLCACSCSCSCCLSGCLFVCCASCRACSRTRAWLLRGRCSRRRPRATQTNWEAKKGDRIGEEGRGWITNKQLGHTAKHIYTSSHFQQIPTCILFVEYCIVFLPKLYGYSCDLKCSITEKTGSLLFIDLLLSSNFYLIAYI